MIYERIATVRCEIFDQLAADLITMTGNVVEKPVKADASWTLIAQTESQLLPTLAVVNKHSQGFYAEQVFKTVAAEKTGQGSWASAIATEKQFLAAIGLDPTHYDLHDGSGLAAGNLVTPQAFAKLLAYMHRHPKGGPFVAGLPHAGQPGSLLKRFVATPLEGRVIAKTGSIDRVNSLSGYIERANGRTITFSVQANGHAVPYQQMLNQIDSVVVQIGRP